MAPHGTTGTGLTNRIPTNPAIMAIPDHFTIQFGKNFDPVSAQTVSRFRKAAIVDTSVTGEAKTHNLVDTVEDQESTGTRVEKTVLQELDTEKRWIRPRKFDLATYDVPFDEKLLAPTIMPGGKHIMAHGGAYGRRLDRVFLEGLLGVNYKGKEGTTATNIPAANIVAVDFVSSGLAADSGLTIDKIIRAKRVLIANQSYSEEKRATGVRLWGGLTAEMEEDLLFLANQGAGTAGGNRLFSKDFMPPVLNEDGSIKFFLGINWISSEFLPRDEADSTLQFAPIWTSDGAYLDIWQDKKSKVSERDDLKYITQFYSEYAFNAIRAEDKRVAKITCKVAAP